MNFDYIRKTKLIDIYRIVKDGSIRVSQKVISIIPKNDRLLLFNAWFGQKYSDNTMYLYEYLLDSKKYHVVWTTKNRKIYNKLKQENKPVVMSNSIKGIWTQIRAKVLFSTIQLNDYNPWFLSKCLLVDLDHGIIFKQVGYDIYSETRDYAIKHDMIAKKNIQYYMSTPSFLTMLMMEHSYHISSNNILLLGKARLDYFYDETLRKDDRCRKLKSGKRAIVYMPTHRQCGKVKLHMDKLLDLEFIDKICEEMGYIFIIKKHFYHRDEKENISKYKNIIDVTAQDIDAQDMLYNADILITDYSSCYIDFLLLNRPVILYTFDLSDYLKTERGLFIDMNDLDIGYKVDTKDQLNSAIKEAITDKDDKYEAKRNKIKQIYFDDSLPFGHFREQIIATVEKLINGTYSAPWEEIEEMNLKVEGFDRIAQYIINK